ncbi:MAG: glutamate-1-semialdehyde 2,1-aminomutase [Deferribacteraceae bacterium]|jgi:glutamate-1-semialdehyde 2,1-aminomutase|nr:glutamate-1-semialdehyde 2,1-aminomutase [Deferribacteraceae bacterium]
MITDIFERSKRVIPGGVNSPVRAFRSVGGTPYFVSSAKGSKITDISGREYIDYVCSWGPMILGHAEESVISAIKSAADKGTSYGAPTVAEVELAELITEFIPSAESVRMVSSGTEAVMSAIRLARAYTSRDMFIKFEGCYHGHSDALLVKAGSGLLTFGTPSSPGVPADTTKNTLVASYNDLASVKKLFQEYPKKIACVIVEPVAANMGVVLPKDGFLQGLREICDKEGALLIFDEIITGFRLAKGGAQEFFDVVPDITALGKIVGGGLPVGAYAGSKKIMNLISPEGPVYQAGTLSGNPLAMAAGIATLKKLKEKDFYKKLNTASEALFDGMLENGRALGYNFTLNHIGSLGSLFFTEKDVVGYESAVISDTAKYARFFHLMLDKAIAFAPAQFEAIFVSSAHSEADIENTLKAHYICLRNL